MSSSARLDAALAQRGIVQSRQRAKELITGGNVTVNGIVITKPSHNVSDTDAVCITGGELKYVSRAGLKLERAAQKFSISFHGKVCADIGASTGGFTDYMLQNGAKRVYAVDVGHGQLAEKLLADKRVINLEGVNVKELKQGFFEEKISIMTADLSFISLKIALPYMLSATEYGTELVLLIKPQFEAGRSAVGKGGIVKDKKAHINVLREVCAFVSNLGCRIYGLTYSPVKGGDGNIEYLLYAEYSNTNQVYEADLAGIVANAFDALR